MAEVDERLVPRDGLNSYHVVLSRVDLPSGGNAQFTFSLTSALLPIADLQVEVPVHGQGLDRMTVEAHDALIDILRQLVFRAEAARRHHERNASRQGGDAPAPAAADEERDVFVLDAGSAPGWRLTPADPGFETIEPVSPG